MIVIIDYGVGNLGSVANMLKKVGAEAIISSDISTIKRANKLILPGVGAFDNAMKNLNDSGFVPVLNDKVFRDRTPILGICLGMQLFAQRSEEGGLPGLGWLEAEVIKFRPDEARSSLRIPHMGWNFIQVKKPNPIFDDMYQDPRFYFVHSYHIVCVHDSNVLATSHYGYEFTAAVVKGNIVGAQFHPEKSHKFGMKLMRNFAERA